MYSHYTGSWGCWLLFASLSKRLWSEYVEAWMNVWMHSLELSWDHLSWWFGWWMPPHAFTPGKLNTCSLFGWHSLGVVTASRRYSLAAGSGLWRVLGLSHVQFTFSAVVWLSVSSQLPASVACCSAFPTLPRILFGTTSHYFFLHKWLRVMVFHHRNSKVAHTSS